MVDRIDRTPYILDYLSDKSRAKKILHFAWENADIKDINIRDINFNEFSIEVQPYFENKLIKSKSTPSWIRNGKILFCKKESKNEKKFVSLGKEMYCVPYEVLKGFNFESKDKDISFFNPGLDDFYPLPNGLYIPYSVLQQDWTLFVKVSPSDLFDSFHLICYNRDCNRDCNNGDEKEEKYPSVSLSNNTSCSVSNLIPFFPHNLCKQFR